MENIYPEIDHTLCVKGCRKCIKVCPRNVLARDKNRDLRVVRPENCNGCGDCTRVCPVGAIWIN